jgi:triose/dihydroxyacetone kinase / FAD-AMP lyase (cyclizing)
MPALDALPLGLDHSAAAARAGANFTSTLTVAKAGRSAYINPDQLIGHVDPGAEAVARLFEHLAS